MLRRGIYALADGMDVYSLVQPLPAGAVFGVPGAPGEDTIPAWKSQTQKRATKGQI